MAVWQAIIDLVPELEPQEDLRVFQYSCVWAHRLLKGNFPAEGGRGANDKQLDRGVTEITDALWTGLKRATEIYTDYCWRGRRERRRIHNDALNEGGGMTVKVSELHPDDIVLVGTGYSRHNKDIDFRCKVSGTDYNGRIILDAQNAVCMDGRNNMQPYFIVDKRSKVEKITVDEEDVYRLGVAYVIYDLKGMDHEGRFILQTLYE